MGEVLASSVDGTSWFSLLTFDRNLLPDSAPREEGEKPRDNLGFGGPKNALINWKTRNWKPWGMGDGEQGEMRNEEAGEGGLPGTI